MTIPRVIQGTLVNGIATGAFSNCTTVTSVTFSNGPTSIEYRAFNGCTSLTNIMLPDSLTASGL